PRTSSACTGDMNFGTAQGQATRGGISSLIRTTSHRACCTAGRKRQSRHNKATAQARIATDTMFCSSHHSMALTLTLALAFTLLAFQLVEHLTKLINLGRRKALLLNQCQHQRRGRAAAQLIGKVLETLTKQFVARNRRPKDVGDAPLVAGDEALGLQALEHGQDRGVSPAATVAARAGVDLPHRAGTVLPKQLQQIELIFAERGMAWFHHDGLLRPTAPTTCSGPNPTTLCTSLSRVFFRFCHSPPGRSCVVRAAAQISRLNSLK